MVNVLNWKKWTVGELVSQTKTTIQTGPFGTVLSASEFVDYGIPVISVREIREGFIRITAETPCVTDDTYSRLGKYALSANDIVFARKGSVERSALIPAGIERYFLGSDGIRIRFDQSVVNPDLMLYIFQSPAIKRLLIQSSYGTTMAGLNEKILSVLEFYLPETVEEQKHIAQVLADIDEQLALTEKIISKKKAIKQGVMQELLTGKRRLPGFNGAWREVRLEDICSKITDGSHESPPESDVGYYMPSVKDMTSTGFDYSECKKISYADFKKLERNGCRPDIGDVLIAKDGSILKYAFVQEQAETIVILSSIAIVKPLFNCVDSFFLAQYFRQQNFVEQVITNYKSGTGVPRIVLKGFKQIELFIPESVAEQATIAKILVDMDKEIAGLEKKLGKYRQVKQGMMQQLLTGKIRLM